MKNLLISHFFLRALALNIIHIFASLFYTMLKDFKPTFIILLRFLGIYGVLVGVYQWYLNYYEGKGLDPISRWISVQPTFLQNACGYRTHLVPDPNQDAVWFYTSKIWTAVMVEGCNAVSVMILFLAFVFAFYKGKKTFSFAIIGLVLLHIINVLRIMMMNIIAIELPKSYFKMAHDYLFPAIIYGSVVILWVVWIKFFVLKDEKTR